MQFSKLEEAADRETLYSAMCYSIRDLLLSYSRATRRETRRVPSGQE